MYTMYFKSIKMSSYMCGKYYVHNVFHMVHRVAMAY
jgi:hypothetical protein